MSAKFWQYMIYGEIRRDYQELIRYNNNEQQNIKIYQMGSTAGLYICRPAVRPSVSI